MTTASIVLRGVTSGAFKYGEPLSSEIRTPLGAHPIFFLTSLRIEPWRPMTIPGERAYRHLARLRLEIDPGDLRFRRDHLADDLLRLLGCREQGRVRPDDDPAPQLLGDLSHEVVGLCEDLHVLRVDHDRGAFEVDLRDFHVVRDHFLHDASRVVHNVLDGHRTSLWPEPLSGLRPVSYLPCAFRLPCRRTS